MRTLVIIHLFQKNNYGLWQEQIPNQHSIAIGEWSSIVKKNAQQSLAKIWSGEESFATSKDQTPGPRSLLEIRERK